VPRGEAKAGKGALALGAAAQPLSAALATAAGVLPGRLFITRMAADITQEDLRAYFQQFGELNDVYIPPGGKLIAFVGFKDAAAAQSLLQLRTHEVKPGSTVDVDVAVERPPLGAKGQGKLRFQPY